MWLEVKAFDRIVNQQAKRQDSEFRHGGASGQPVRSKLQPEQVQYLKCPDCQRHMHRRNFARASGVIIDECKDHGVWLDCDELGKIAAFVASGGLAYARQLKKLDDQAPKPTDYVPIPAFSKFPPISRPTRPEDTPLGSVLQIVRALLG
jgi:Zn-finger nucleic acid-binding protein